MKLLKSFAAGAAILALSAPFALASPDGHGGTAYGKPGKASAASRTIEIVMGDNYYEPETISVKEGETVRFVVKNEGDFVHEFQIGNHASFEEHAPMMAMMVEHGVLEVDRINHDVAESMEASMGHGMHDETNAVLLEPGQSGEVVWTFPENAEVAFACTVPGHLESGMEGEFELTN